MICKGHVAAERQSTYYRCISTSEINKGAYVTNCFFFAILNSAVGIIRFAVAAHIPNDQSMAFA